MEKFIIRVSSREEYADVIRMRPNWNQNFEVWFDYVDIWGECDIHMHTWDLLDHFPIDIKVLTYEEYKQLLPKRLEDFKKGEALIFTNSDDRRRIYSILEEKNMRMIRGSNYSSYPDVWAIFPGEGLHTATPGSTKEAIGYCIKNGYLWTLSSDFIEHTPANLELKNMETKETLQVPEGMEFSHIDAKGVIHLKPKEKKFPSKSWECLKGKTFYITGYGKVQNYKPSNLDYLYDTTARVHHQTAEQAEAFLALIQLVTLCKKWNEIDGFTPDFKDITYNKYVIKTERGELIVTAYLYTGGILAFKTRERANQFLRTFKELIDIALPLI